MTFDARDLWITVAGCSLLALILIALVIYLWIRVRRLSDRLDVLAGDARGLDPRARVRELLERRRAWSSAQLAVDAFTGQASETAGDISVEIEIE